MTQIHSILIGITIQHITQQIMQLITIIKLIQMTPIPTSLIGITTLQITIIILIQMTQIQTLLIIGTTTLMIIIIILIQMQQILTILISITTLHITQQTTQHHIIQVPIIQQIKILRQIPPHGIIPILIRRTRTPQAISHIHTVIQLICPLMSLV